MTVAVDQIDTVSSYSIYQIGLHWLIAAREKGALITGHGTARMIRAVAV